MKKFVVLLVVLMLTACALSAPPDGEGYILEVSEQSILVIDEPILDASWNEIFEEYTGTAMMLSTSRKNLKVGQKVRYWIDGDVNTSYPSQAKAKRIEVID